MNKNTSIGLFGGAWLAAGLSAQPQNFIYHDSDPSGVLDSYVLVMCEGGPSLIAYRPQPLTLHASGSDPEHGQTTMKTSQTPVAMRAEGGWDGAGTAGYGYGLTTLTQYFELLNDATMLIEWDVSGSNGKAGVALVNAQTQEPVYLWGPHEFGDPPTGSVEIQLLGETDYALAFGLYNIFASGGGFALTSTQPKYVNVRMLAVPCSLADTNGDGVLDNGDIIAFVAAFLGGDLVADINQDGVLDNGDIMDYITAFLAGC